MMQPKRLVPRLRSVEVMEWTGENWDDISTWVYGSVIEIEDYDSSDFPVAHDGHFLSVLEPGKGEEIAQPEDWLVKDHNGDWYVGSADVIDEMYIVE